MRLAKNWWPGKHYCGESLIELKVNEACLHVTSLFSTPTEVEWQNTECHNCDLFLLGKLDFNTTKTFVIETTNPLFLQVKGKPDINVTEWLDDFGVYSWTLNDGKPSNLIEDKCPEYFWMNISIIVGILVLYQLSTLLVKLLIGKCCRGPPFQELQNDEQIQEESHESRSVRPTRVATIDIFRGVAISIMIFVNYGGGQYSVFKHAPWDGLTVADVVFPFFIWIMGVTLVISLRSQLRACADRRTIICKIVRRCLTLVCLGIMLNSGKVSKTGLRIPGVLQRIGLTYLIVATVELVFGRPQRSQQYGPWVPCSEIQDAPLQWVFALLMAAAHTIITFVLPVPDCPTGYLGPGGLADNSSYFNCTGGAAGYIDRLIFTPNHIYQHPTSQRIYQSVIPFDPEGILGLLNSVFLAFLGAHCGRIILSYENPRHRILRWLLFSVITGITAGLLCDWSQHGGIIPVNKNLWSLSYVLASNSIAICVFTVIYWLVDVKSLWSGRPFVYAGMNSIALYLGHEMLNRNLPWRWTPLTSTHFELLAMDVAATAWWLLISYFMFQKHIFVAL